jgi:hypothetical protein
MADTHLIDPLGREVVLHDSTWFGHICRVHGDMGRHRRRVERAVRSPVVIRVSHSDSNCRLYFAPGPRRLLVVVVADVVGGVVKTAYLGRKIAGGIIEWSSPTP